MGTTAPAPRIAWAVDRLHLGGTEHILEVGCGHGVAVGMMCSQITTGHVLAIDRSAAMAAAATRRNSAYIAAGKATIRAGPISDVDLGPQLFDYVLAINVRSLIRSPEIDRVTIRLRADGELHFVMQSPPGSSLKVGAAEIGDALEQHNLTVTDLTTTFIGDIEAVGAIAVPGR
jgi:SAM-dependent methyltransferase